jgi:5-methylcytosine-specific restriction endonuclease McrA
MSKVLLLDTTKQPLDPVHPGRARLLLKAGKAAVYRRYPFTLILKRQVNSPTVSALRLKVDPGAKTTGLALVDDASGEVVWAAELSHRGASIKKRMDSRRDVRRKRRSRKTRYRQPRFRNRKRARSKGRLPPSLESRVANVLTWVERLRRLCPIGAISMELVKFDTQAMQDPEITGMQYQQGERMGYEVREYLLEKWERRCAYCGAKDVPLEIEHILCRARGGTHRVSNLTLACEPCNVKKGTQLIEDFLHKQPDVLARILAQARAPLTDTAAVNATRWVLFERLKATGLPLETGSGGLTKYNRESRTLPKTHWVDAACVGRSTPEHLETSRVRPLLIAATGHGNRQMCGTDKHGFPIRHRQRHKVHFGYQTGDLVRAVVPKGARAGTHVGRVLARASGSFDLVTKAGRQAGISYRYCRPIHRNDGYSYQQGMRHAVPA